MVTGLRRNSSSRESKRYNGEHSFGEIRMLENKAGFRNYKLLGVTVAHSSPVATQSRVPKLSYLVQHHISVAISCCRDICSCSSSDRTTALCPA
jgi:hypothetical protein